LEEAGRETEKELQEQFGADNFIYRTCDGANDAQIRGKETIMMHYYIAQYGVTRQKKMVHTQNG